MAENTEIESQSSSSVPLPAENKQSAPDKIETTGEDYLKSLERRINLTEALMIGVAVVVGLGFIAAIFELGFIVHDDYVAKQEGYHYLVEKIHQQDLTIQELQIKYANRKK